MSSRRTERNKIRKRHIALLTEGSPLTGRRARGNSLTPSTRPTNRISAVTIERQVEKDAGSDLNAFPSLFCPEWIVLGPASSALLRSG